MREPGRIASSRAPGRIASAILALAAGIALLLAPSASADPRWWWNDLRVTVTDGRSLMPHITGTGYVSGGAMFPVFIVWSEEDPAGGDLEIWLTASFDQGCSFCAPTRLTDNTVDDTNPRVAVLNLPEGTFSFAVAFESAGDVVVAWDSTSASYRVPLEQYCGEIAKVGPGVVGNGRYVNFGAPGAAADHPDVAAAWCSQWGHFHLVWHDTREGQDDIYYARDLTARGGIGWTMTPAKNLTPGVAEWANATGPVLACDILTDPDPLTGDRTMNRSAANVAFLDVEPGGGRSRVAALRSVDSGETFSAAGDRADGPAGLVSDPDLSPRGRPAIDTAWSSWNFEQPVWMGAAWERGPAPGASGVSIDADIRRMSTPATPAPDWSAPDANVCAETAGAGEGGPAIALETGGALDRVPAWIFWEDSRPGPLEILAHGGILDAAAGGVLDLQQFPIPAVRALDPVVSADFQLSRCAFDPATFACLPDRAAGEARDVETYADTFGTHAVWTDTRDGNAEIYYKRTDENVWMQAAQGATGCSAPGIAYAEITFAPVRTCPLSGAGERMGRYLVYRGTDPGGPFDNAADPVVIPHDAIPGPAATVRFDGLAPGATYRFLVVPEDQARNVSPAAFDPFQDLPNPNPGEVSIDTPAPCDVGDQVCLYRSDVTDVEPHVPPKAQVYLVPPTVEDVSLRGAPYQCPFATGDLEKDGAAYRNGVPLVLYQVNRPVGTLRVRQEGTGLRFEF